jgi:O-antigen/teichoic acid export membrane protein
VLVWAIAVAGLLLVAGLLRILPIGNWVHFETMTTDTVRWILFLFSGEVLVRLIDAISHAGFRATGDYPLHTGIRATTRLFQFAAIWVIATLGGGPGEAVVGFFCITLVGTAFSALLLRSRHRWLVMWGRNGSLKELRRLLNPALAHLALPLVNALSIQGMVLVVGATLGPQAVVVFATLRTLTRVPFQMMVIFNRAAEPEYASAYGTNRSELVRKLFVHALRASLWMSMVAVIGLVLLGNSILDLWTRGEVPMDWPLFSWLLAAAVASTLWNTPLSLLKALNQHLRAAAIFAGASTAALALAWFLLWTTHDLSQAGLALLVMNGTIGLYVMSAATAVLHTDGMCCFRAALNPSPLIAVIGEQLRNGFRKMP